MYIELSWTQRAKCTHSTDWNYFLYVESTHFRHFRLTFSIFPLQNVFNFIVTFIELLFRCDPLNFDVVNTLCPFRSFTVSMIASKKFFWLFLNVNQHFVSFTKVECIPGSRFEVSICHYRDENEIFLTFFLGTLSLLFLIWMLLIFCKIFFAFTDISQSQIWLAFFLY